MIKSLILFSFLINTFFASLHVSSITLVLSTSSLLAKIKFLLRLRGASSLAIPAFNAVTIATLLIHINTSSPQMSSFLNTLLSSLPHHLPVPRSYLYLLSLPFQPYPQGPQLLHLNRCRFILIIRVPTPCLPMTHLLWRPPSTTSVFPSTADPPISIRKGTRFSRNPRPIYTFLSYHRLSSSYPAFISILSYVSLPNIVHEALSHPGRKQAMVEEIVALHSTGT